MADGPVINRSLIVGRIVRFDHAGGDVIARVIEPDDAMSDH